MQWGLLGPEQLREAAQRFLDEDKDPTEGRMATAFCRECVEADPAATIRNLVKRDDRVCVPETRFSVDACSEQRKIAA